MKNTSEYSNYLQTLMKKVDISTIEELSNLSGISKWQLFRLEEGLLPKMEIQFLLKLSKVLQVSIQEIIENFCSESLLSDGLFHSSISLQTNKSQLDHLNLQTELEKQKNILENQFQQETLQTLESYLIQFPTLVAAIEKNPDLPAKRIISIMKPLEKLLKKWNVKPLETVGEEVSYNPQIHQLMEGLAKTGDKVKIRYVGYLQGEKILYRAKVSPAKNSP